jgi:hypothetical protein
MSEQEMVPVVGGPKDGEMLPYFSGGTWCFPSAQDCVLLVCEDGHICRLYGDHKYVLRTFARFHAVTPGYDVCHQWEYVGYTPPNGTGTG